MYVRASLSHDMLVACPGSQPLARPLYWCWCCRVRDTAHKYSHDSKMVKTTSFFLCVHSTNTGWQHYTAAQKCVNQIQCFFFQIYLMVKHLITIKCTFLGVVMTELITQGYLSFVVNTLCYHTIIYIVLLCMFLHLQPSWPELWITHMTRTFQLARSLYQG